MGLVGGLSFGLFEKEDGADDEGKGDGEPKDAGKGDEVGVESGFVRGWLRGFAVGALVVEGG